MLQAAVAKHRLVNSIRRRFRKFKVRGVYYMLTAREHKTEIHLFVFTHFPIPAGIELAGNIETLLNVEALKSKRGRVGTHFDEGNSV